MSEDEEVGKLVERIDELLLILSRVSDDLKDVSGSLKSMTASQTAQPTTAPPPAETEVSKAQGSTEEVEDMFPDELKNLLSFEDEGDYVKIKPRQFLGSDNFAKIASIIRGVGGEYISAGKKSHFRVPKK
ncbi:MAG: hypothetical protein ACOC6H_03560 [Thermoproteota archaeon]